MFALWAHGRCLDYWTSVCIYIKQNGDGQEAWCNTTISPHQCCQSPEIAPASLISLSWPPSHPWCSHGPYVRLFISPPTFLSASILLSVWVRALIHTSDAYVSACTCWQRWRPTSVAVPTGAQRCVLPDRVASGDTIQPTRKVFQKSKRSQPVVHQAARPLSVNSL